MTCIFQDTIIGIETLGNNNCVSWLRFEALNIVYYSRKQ